MFLERQYRGRSRQRHGLQEGKQRGRLSAGNGLDQAKKKVSCVTLLKGHPNVSKLASREVDTSTLFDDGVPHPNSALIREEYIKNLKGITMEQLEVLDDIAIQTFQARGFSSFVVNTNISKFV